MEMTPYMESVTGQRAMRLSPEEALAGNITISLETCESCIGNIGDWAASHTALFLKLVSKLPAREQDLLLSAYLLRKTQGSMANIFQLRQSNLAQKLFVARQHLADISTGTDLKPERKVWCGGRNLQNVYLKLPEELGQFRVDVTSPGFDAKFTSTSVLAQHTNVEE